MSCLSPYLRIKIGYKKWSLVKVKTEAGESVIHLVDHEAEGVLKEKALLLMDLPSNRKVLDEMNTPYEVIPCGVCDECYKKRVKEWSIRILNETKYHDENYFITLTYDNFHLPSNRSLDKKRVQTFFKSLKKKLSRQFEGIKIKYYCVGEYGDGKGQREYLNPHYHFIGFNIPLSLLGLTDIFPDGHKHYSDSGDQLMYCQFVSDLWPEGFVTIQEVTYGSACYVAGYVHKKLNRDRPIIHEELCFFNIKGKATALVLPVRYDPYSFLGVETPWSLMSKGIGEQFLLDNIDKIYDTDEVFYNSGKFGVLSSLPPRYFDKKLEVHNPEKAKLIKDKRTALSISKQPIVSDKEFLYNKSIRIANSERKKDNRKRGLASLS